MIFYFSGTGNSKYVAEKIAATTGDELISLNEKIKNSDYQAPADNEKLVFVLPTYAWRIPKIVATWLTRATLPAGRAWFVMTCGAQIGNAAKYNRQLCALKNLTYMGTAQIIMPENYIAMFAVPDWPQAEKIIDLAAPDIQQAAEQIKTAQPFKQPRNNLLYRAMSALGNAPFYKVVVKAGPFLSRENCTGCGKCARLCPLNNITLQNSRPHWGPDCTHCMACICSCPVEAIEYGKKSVGKPRYICKKKV